MPSDTYDEIESRKVFTPSGCFRDHFKIMTQIPKIYGAYVGPNAVDAKLSECIMMAVNSANQCPYCTELHGELSRLADVQKQGEDILQSDSVTAVQKVAPNPSVLFARKFGEHSGRGAELDAEYKSLQQSVGPKKAASVYALCWFLHWGSISGNTLNHFLFRSLVGKAKQGANVLFLGIFALYYIICYGLIKLTSMMFKLFPRIPPAFSAVIGVVLCTVASLWILPLGIIGGLLYPVLGNGPNVM